METPLLASPKPDSTGPCAGHWKLTSSSASRPVVGRGGGVTGFSGLRSSAAGDDAAAGAEAAGVTAGAGSAAALAVAAAAPALVAPGVSGLVSTLAGCTGLAVATVGSTPGAATRSTWPTSMRLGLSTLF